MKKTISLPFGTDSSISAYLSSAEGGRTYPALIVLEEIWGLNDHIRDVCDRFAAEGFVVLSPELLDETGVLEKISPAVFKEMQSEDEAVKHAAQAKMRDAMAPINTKEFAARTIAKLKACIDYLLADPHVNGTVGVVGFCFGGSYAFQLAIHDDRIKAAIPFYGSAPDPLDSVASIKAPILAFYGEEDSRLVSQLLPLVEAMRTYDREFSYMLYPHAGHAFFNDTRPEAYNEDAARDSWEKSLAFLHTQLD